MAGSPPLISREDEASWICTTHTKPNSEVSYFWISTSGHFWQLHFKKFIAFSGGFYAVSRQNCRYITPGSQDFVPGIWNCQKHCNRPTKTITSAPTPSTCNVVWRLSTRSHPTFSSLWSDGLDEHCLRSFCATSFIVQQFATEEGRYSSSSILALNQGRVTEVSGCKDADTVLQRRTTALVVSANVQKQHTIIFKWQSPLASVLNNRRKVN